MRRFQFHRLEDATGVSGTGIVVEGVQFTDGTVAVRWLTEYRSTAIYNSIDDAMKIHGHDGKTRLVWLETEESDRERRALSTYEYYWLRSLIDYLFAEVIEPKDALRRKVAGAHDILEAQRRPRPGEIRAEREQAAEGSPTPQVTGD